MLTAFKQYLQRNAQISDQQFDLIAEGLTVKEVPKKTVLLFSGEICSHVFFVSKGLLRAYTVDGTGKEHIIQFAPEDWWISDRDSFYCHQPSIFTIDAIEDSIVIYLDHSFFEKAAALTPEFNNFNLKSLHNAIRYMQRRINLLLGATAEERYLDFIRLYPNLTLRIPQWMIASYLGITPESLSRVRKELAHKNFKP